MNYKRPRFLRAETSRFLRIGKKRRKLQKWRRARGKSNKLRLGKIGHPLVPKVGFRTKRDEAGKVNGLMPRLVHNLKELHSLGKDEMAIVARIGAKKKLELIKEAEKLKIKILNLGGKK